jgi:exopolysaccharide biosynthesis polyprenyl glycosylphosphotransferase
LLQLWHEERSSSAARPRSDRAGDLHVLHSNPRRSPRKEGLDWRRLYARRVALTDLAVIASAVAVAHVCAFRFHLLSDVPLDEHPSLGVSYATASVLMIGAWFVALTLADTRKYRVIGVGSAEYRLVFDASVKLLGLVALLALMFRVPLSQGYLAVAFPLGITGLVGTRWVWRRWLGRHRSEGRYSSRVYLVGSEASVLDLWRELARQPQAGYRVVGACIPNRPAAVRAASFDRQVVISSDLDRLTEAMAGARADTLIVASSDDLPASRVRQLSWELEPTGQHLIVAPSLTDVAGPRLHTRPVSGLPLLHVEMPRYSAGTRLAKRVFDFVGALLLLVASIPLLLVVAVAVAVSSRGPVLFAQTRVGLNNKTFKMLKFRSMVVNAESARVDIDAGSASAGNEVLFKLRRDPRVTAVGRIIRRLSLDELPQLVNVLTGAMSLVGPRPPLESEVRTYDNHVHRRFLVKPGMTGLWQVNGRSDLSWEDSVRLDLFYVENWSITGDMVILGRTLRAALGGSGAY